MHAHLAAPKTMLDTLKQLVEQNEGALGAIMMGYDGITIEKYISPKAGMDLEIVTTEFSIKIRELRQAAQSLDLGELRDITVKASNKTMLFHEVNDEIFVALILSNAKSFGRSRWRLRKGAISLRSEI